MSDAETVALISTAGLVLVALIGLLVEQVRTRRRADSVVHEVTPNSGASMRDVVDRIDRRLVTSGERGERTEGKVDRLASRFDAHLEQAARESRIIERIVRHLDLPDA
ncbi:hypothetical protein [Jiangella muralis]|uniref:hypothetical protein n=1 Tax=Jiangella muralis TaxID=702383 RepID=UPI00069F6AC5|nr:hypothetical protein [Jiangella muralis]